jgi:hypothetical protein
MNQPPPKAQTENRFWVSNCFSICYFMI